MYIHPPHDLISQITDTVYLATFNNYSKPQSGGGNEIQVASGGNGPCTKSLFDTLRLSSLPQSPCHLSIRPQMA